MVIAGTHPPETRAIWGKGAPRVVFCNGRNTEKKPDGHKWLTNLLHIMEQGGPTGMNSPALPVPCRKVSKTWTSWGKARSQPTKHDCLCTKKGVCSLTWWLFRAEETETQRNGNNSEVVGQVGVYRGVRVWFSVSSLMPRFVIQNYNLYTVGRPIVYNNNKNKQRQLRKLNTDWVL